MQRKQKDNRTRNIGGGNVHHAKVKGQAKKKNRVGKKKGNAAIRPATSFTTRVAPRSRNPYGSDLRGLPPNTRRDARMSLSKCAAEYFNALVDPFRSMDYPCIPDQIATPSWKFSTSLTVTMTVGTGKVGWVVISPWAMAASDPVNPGGNDPIRIATSAMYYTNSTYAAGVNNNFPIFNPTASVGSLVGGVTGVSPANAFFNNAQWRAGEKSWRPVACGLRITPTGTISNRSGTITLVRFDPNIFPSDGGDRSWNTNDFMNRPDFRTVSATAGPYVVSYIPKQLEYTEYHGAIDQPDAPTYSGNAVAAALPAGVGAYVVGAQPGDTYLCQVIAYFEALSDGMPTTKSHSDPPGLAAVMQAVQQNGGDVEMGQVIRALNEQSGRFSN